MILAVLGLLSARLRNGGLSALGFKRPASWPRVVQIALAAAALRIALGEFVINPLTERFWPPAAAPPGADEITGSIKWAALALLIAWTFAAFGEEIACGPVFSPTDSSTPLPSSWRISVGRTDPLSGRVVPLELGELSAVDPNRSRLPRPAEVLWALDSPPPRPRSPLSRPRSRHRELGLRYRDPGLRHRDPGHSHGDPGRGHRDPSPRTEIWVSVTETQVFVTETWVCAIENWVSGRETLASGADARHEGGANVSPIKPF